MADYSEQLDAIAKGPKAGTADGMSVTAQDPEAITNRGPKPRMQTACATFNSLFEPARPRSTKAIGSPNHSPG